MTHTENMTVHIDTAPLTENRVTIHTIKVPELQPQTMLIAMIRDMDSVRDLWFPWAGEVA